MSNIPILYLDILILEPNKIFIMDNKRSLKHLLLSFLLSGIILILSSCTHKEILKGEEASYVVTTYDASISIDPNSTHYMYDTVSFVSNEVYKEDVALAT